MEQMMVTLDGRVEPNIMRQRKQTRTGCCGCPISYKAVDDLELIRPYEPGVVKAAWNIFGDSYRYRLQYNEYKAK